MPKVIFNGKAGDAFTNDTDRVLYQFHASLTNTCGVCLSYHLAISSFWPIPIHRNCSCVQRVVKPGGKAEPWVDFRKLLDAMPHDQKVAAVGASNYQLLKKGLVKWADVVTDSRVRTFREVVAIEKLSVDRMVKAGVRKGVAESAWASVHTPAHEIAAAHRKTLVENLTRAGLSPQQVRERFGAGVASRVRLVGPHGPGGGGVTVKPTPIEPLIPKLGLDSKKVEAAMKAAEAAKKVEPPAFPASIDGLTHGRRLGGETGARLVKDPDTGASYVLKRGVNEGHLRAEAAADAIYKAAGVPVPESRVYETPSGPAKLSEYIQGRTLGALKRSDRAAYDRAAAKVREGFALDALLANRDVVGFKSDNVVVDDDGRAYRVDNGGAMDYLPDGRRKAPSWWADSTRIDELEAMRDAYPGTPNEQVFGPLGDDALRAQIDLVERMAEAIVEAAPEAYRAVLRLRLKLLDEFKPAK